MVNLSEVNVVTLNVNGLRGESKRRSIFNLLKHCQSNIILLQETHSTKNDERVWSNEWGSKIIFNHGTNFSKGVAVLFQRHFPVQINSTHIDTDGRYIILELKVEEIQFVLINVYGPNDDNKLFFSNLFNNINKRDNNSIILTGDFNVTMDPDMDLYNNTGASHKQKRSIISTFLEEKGLVDVWRLLHPEERTFTWKKPFTNDIIMSRLDYFFISQDFLLRTNFVTIKPKLLSDHCRVILNLDFATTQRGRGFWKFNNLFLKDPQFLATMNDLIKEYLFRVKSKEEHPCDIQWEKLKLMMSTCAKDYAGKKAKEKSLLIEKFEQRIITLDKKLLNTTNVKSKKPIYRDIKKSELFLLGEYDK